MSRHRFTGGFSAGWTWTQWMIGIWWWPVKKDLAAGIHLGPFYATWERRHRLGDPYLPNNRTPSVRMPPD